MCDMLKFIYLDDLSKQKEHLIQKGMVKGGEV